MGKRQKIRSIFSYFAESLGFFLILLMLSPIIIVSFVCFILFSFPIYLLFILIIPVVILAWLLS